MERASCGDPSGVAASPRVAVPLVSPCPSCRRAPRVAVPLVPLKTSLGYNPVPRCLVPPWGGVCPEPAKESSAIIHTPHDP